MNVGKNSNLFKPFDGSDEKMQELLEKSGAANKSALEISLGHCSGFFAGCKTRGYIRTSDIMTIKTLFGVDVELHQPEPKRLLKNEESELKDESLDSIRKKIGANNVISKQISDQIESMNVRIANLQKQNEDVINTLHTIGNLLAQINEKMFKEKK